MLRGRSLETAMIEDFVTAAVVAVVGNVVPAAVLFDSLLPVSAVASFRAPASGAQLGQYLQDDLVLKSVRSK